MGSDRDLSTRLAECGRTLAAREAPHAEALGKAKKLADSLHARVAEGLAAYHAAVVAAPQLTVVQGRVKHDEKHLHAFEFDVRRGRHRVIVVVKSRGEVTLVGPFHMGKDEGPCRRIAFGRDDGPSPDDEMIDAVGDVLERFLEEAAQP